MGNVVSAKTKEAKVEPKIPDTIDPVCGMRVDPAGAKTKGLVSTYRGRDYFFCGKGCKLEFDESPDRYLDQRYVPSM